MSELFTQTDKQKKLFRTEENIVANIQTQFGMPHTGKDLLLDAKMGPNKDQSSRLDSEPDALSDTGMSDDVGAGDTSGILHDSAGGNKNTITGTNTPRSSRTSAYYDLLRSQHKNGHYKAPAYRVVDAIESPLQAGAGALNYHDDFDTDAVQNAGLHIAVAQTVVEGNIMAAAADSAFVIGKQTGNILKDLKDETINAKDALKAGGKVLRLQGGKSVVKIGDATLRSTEQYLSSFQVSTDDFTGSVPGKVKEAANIIGYDRVDGTYVINEEQAATVRRIFNLYAEGHGETTVAKMLIEENRKDGGGGLSWTASKVSRVLRKPTYKGYMTYNKSHIDDFLSHNRINHSEEDFVLVKGNFEPIVSEELWETCNQIRSKRAAFVKGKDGRAHKFGVSFPQNKWTKILFCDCGMRFQIEGYDKTANGGKNMRLICARSKMFKKKDAARTLNGIPCPAPYASEWKLELMAREVFRTVWKENAEDILGLLRTLDANLNTTGTPNDGNQMENKLSALNEELDNLVSQRASRSITMDDFLSKSTEINNEIINVEGLLQSSIQEQRPKARLDMHSIEAALSDDASFPDGKIEPGFLDRYTNRIVKSNNRYIWMLQLMNVQQIMPIQSERQPIAMVTYKSGVPYDIEQEQIGKQDKESAGPDCATICRPQDFFLNMSRTKRKRKLVEWLESCQENQVRVLDEKIPLLSFAVDFVTAYEYQKARGIKIHPGLWKDMRVDIFLVKKEN